MTRKIIDTKHSIDRFLDKNRFDDAGATDFRKKLNRVITDASKKIITKLNDEEGVYGIHSKSTGIGVVIDWRPDKYGSDRTNHAVIITLLPLKPKHHYKNVSDEVIVERRLNEMLGRKRDGKDSARIIHKGAFKIVLWEGKYYDSNATWIFVR